MLPISHVASPVKDWEWRTDPKVIEEINNELKELFENGIHPDSARRLFNDRPSGFPWNP
jgi:hypothetical protein